MKELVVKLKVDGSGVFPAFATLEKRVNSLASGGFGRLKSAISAAFSVGAIAAYTKSTVDWAGRITDVATRLGVSTEYLQEMDFALKQSGSSMDDLVGFTERLNKAREEALSGSPRGQRIAETFKTTFGIDATTLRGPVQPIIDAIARQFESGNVQTLTTALSNMGIRGAGALTAAFADGLADGRSTARKVGAIVSSDVVEQLDMAGDQLSAFATVLRAEFAPSVVATARALVQATGYLKSRMDYIVGGTSGWSTKDWIRAAIVKTTPGHKNLIAQGAMKPGPQFDNSVAEQMQKEVEEKFEAILKGIEDAVKARNERRIASGSRRGPSTGFGFLDAMLRGMEASIKVADSKLSRPPRAAKERSKPEDPLVSVGNFLGTGRNALEAIGNETNNILKGIDKKLGRVVDNMGGDDSLNLPEI